MESRIKVLEEIFSPASEPIGIAFICEACVQMCLNTIQGQSQTGVKIRTGNPFLPTLGSVERLFSGISGMIALGDKLIPG